MAEAMDAETIDPFAGLRRLTKVKDAHLQQSQVVLAALTEVIGEDTSPIAYFGALMTALQQQAQQDPAAAADPSLSPMLYLLGCVFPHVPSSYVCLTWQWVEEKGEEPDNCLGNTCGPDDVDARVFVFGVTFCVSTECEPRLFHYKWTGQRALLSEWDRCVGAFIHLIMQCCLSRWTQV